MADTLLRAVLIKNPSTSLPCSSFGEGGSADFQPVGQSDLI